MSSKSDQATVLHRRVAFLEEVQRRLGSGVKALQVVALSYGAHRSDCAVRATPDPAPCSCGWDSTRVMIEQGMAKQAQTQSASQPKLVTL